jgi:8-oxo-dGTP pyrophosphatase MutT (NUDIX family)
VTDDSGVNLVADALALQRTLTALAVQPRPPAVVDLIIAGRSSGFCSQGIAEFVAASVDGFRLHTGGRDKSARDSQFVLDDRDDEPDPVEARSVRLAAAARALEQAGRIHGWRNELLDIHAPDGSGPLARIERAACRCFAIATTAVHLNAWSADGRLWIAQRSPHKTIDPGLWDTVVGGMLAAGESEIGGLQREAHEEAGLVLTGTEPAFGGELRFERVVPEGFQVETICAYDLVLADGVVPRNLDGEVAAFALRTPQEVVAQIVAGQFTLEAAMVTLDGIVRRGGR